MLKLSNRMIDLLHLNDVVEIKAGLCWLHPSQTLINNLTITELNHD